MTVQEAFESALQHHQAGRLADAEALYRQILAAQPDHFDALHLFGVLVHQTGRPALAVEWIRRAITVRPDYPKSHFSLGNALRDEGRLSEAAAAYRHALVLQPDSAETCNNLGNVLARLGDFEQAIVLYRRAVAIKPGYAEAHNNLGVALREIGQSAEAAAVYERARRLRPELPDVHYNLGCALGDLGQYDEALAMYQQALQLDPNHADACNGMAHMFNYQGRLDEAISARRRALHAQPGHAGAHSNLVYTLHFHSSQDARAISTEQVNWNRQFGGADGESILPHANTCDPARRLRIGYVSADFREHVIGHNLRPLFAGHDHQTFEILCYSGVGRPDHVTEEFRQRADHWRNTVGMTDAALSETIREDAVDVLVDLTQHLAGNRLPMFIREPAPVLVSFAGYPECGGVDAIRYRFSDRYLEGERPASETKDGKWEIGWRRESDLRPATKEQVFLIDSFWCYDSSGMEGEVNELPARTGGKVTFGSLNNFCKVNEPLLRLWARVLREVEDSHLMLLSGFGEHRSRTVEFLRREGVAPPRIEFVEPRPRPAYLKLYNRLDVVLDTFPYNGHTTSLDALWMGVPVVTLAGKSGVSRAGLSQLMNLGVPELVAYAEDEYVEIATKLARDLPRLEELRRTLRARMKASVLMDAPRFARNIEAAYRAMWQRWCAERTDK